ncbi:MAG TPA: hypothetical protein VE075_05660 [Thermoanaerobaculia bacterium]|nr:hypothetical protein [Thermoanaerobaculia bacterium]
MSRSSSASMEELPPAAHRLFGDPEAVACREVPRLDAAAPDAYVLARLLEDGDRADLAWLCRRLPAAALAAWLERHGARRLSRRSLAFWAVALDRDDLLPERRPELARRRDLWPL